MPTYRRPKNASSASNGVKVDLNFQWKLSVELSATNMDQSNAVFHKPTSVASLAYFDLMLCYRLASFGLPHFIREMLELHDLEDCVTQVTSHGLID